MKKCIMALLLLAACVLTQAASMNVKAEKPKGSLTILIYMAGSDLETRSGEASKDLQEMISAIPADGAVSVLALTGGASKWHNDMPANKNTLWQIVPGELKQIEIYDQQNMGDSETLSAFLYRGAELFPAARYALILWDHGGGPLGGVCFDERYDMDALSLEELTKGLQNSPFARKKLMFIGFDACLMSSIETACVMAPYAEMMIASQEPEPGEGWDYSFLQELSGETEGKIAAECIIRKFQESQEDSLSPASLSCLDLSRAELVREEIGRLFGTLADEMTESSYQVLARCRAGSRTLGNSTLSEWDLVDLIDLVQRLEKQDITDTSKLLKEAGNMVLLNYASEKRVNGLSIYAPFDNKPRYTQPWSDQYEKMDFAEGYRKYIQKFTGVWLENKKTDWQNKAEVDMEMERNEVRLALPMDEELAENTAYARLLVFQSGIGQKDEYSLVYASERLQPQGGMLRASYSGEALYLMNEKGEVVDGPLEPRPLKDGIALYAILEDVSWNQEGVYLLWRQQADGTYAMTGIETYNAGLDMFTMSSRKPEPGDRYMIGGYVKKLPAEDAAYQDWPWGETIIYCLVPYTDGTQWRLQYLPMNAEYDRFAMFEIVDLQGNVHLSEMFPLDNPDRVRLSLTEQTAGDDRLKLALKDASIVTGISPCIQLNLEIQGNAADIYLQSILLNQTTLSNTAKRMNIQKGENKNRSALITVTAGDLQKAGIRKIETLTLVLSIGDEIRSFAFDFPVDTGMIAMEGESKEEPLFTAEENGLLFEIMHLEKNVYGNLTGRIHINNLSGRNQTLSNSMNVEIDDLMLIGSLEEDGITYTVLPDGFEAWCDYVIYTQTYEDGMKKEIADLDPAGIRQLRMELSTKTRNRFMVEFQRKRQELQEKTRKH